MTGVRRRDRCTDWPSAMRAVIDRHAAAPFAWCVSDCSFWADVVRAMTGVDLRGHALSGYRSARGAERKLRALGFASVLEFVEHHFDEIPPASAMRGDLAVIDGASGPLVSPAVVDGAVVVSKSAGGLVVLPASLCVRAFAV